MQINLNADLGESFGAYTIGSDELLLDIVRSANIACGFHAGDPLVMTRTVEQALAKGVSLGAHPAFPDLQGFGRRVMKMAPAELKAALIYQIGALEGIAKANDGRVTHIKPHGALNNMACEDATLAEAVVEAIREYDRDIILLAPVLSELAKAGEKAGLPVALEVFSDRAYTDAGHLVPRSQPGAVLHDSADCVAHVQRMVERGGIVSLSGQFIATPFHSVCVHGDNVESAETARKVKLGLEEAGCNVVSLPEIEL